MEADARGQKMDGQLGRAGIFNKNRAETVVNPIVVIKPKLLTNRQSKHTFLIRDRKRSGRGADDDRTATSAPSRETTADAWADEFAFCSFDR